MTIEQELEHLTKQGDGVLHPETVVQYAVSPETALHARFEWDDAKAGHQYRLIQARNIINVFVTVIKPDTKPVNVYVSLMKDRVSGGGYRRTEDVMRNKDMRSELLEQALADADAWMQKYHALQELADVFEAIRRVRRPAA